MAVRGHLLWVWTGSWGAGHAVPGGGALGVLRSAGRQAEAWQHLLVSVCFCFPRASPDQILYVFMSFSMLFGGASL